VSAHPVLRAVQRHPSAGLLAAQLTAVLAYPFLDHAIWGRAVIGVVNMVVILAALYAVRRTSTFGWVVLVLGLPALVLTVLEAVLPTHGPVVLASASLHAPFYFYVSYAMVRYLYEDEKVTPDELFATGAAFTVVAWGFSYVLAAVQVIWPGSFTSVSGDQVTWFELLYLSFANLTSVGLSDVLPVLDHARSIVMVEQVVGVLYIALVVARLVGLTAARARGAS
jgi:hypothetical protein